MKIILYSLAILAYSIVIGGILATIRNFIGFSDFELPYLTKFIVVDCYSQNGFSPYFTYVEIMLIPIFVIKLFFIKPNFNATEIQQLYYLFGTFLLQTLWGFLLMLIMLAPLNQYVIPEVLTPPLHPTAIAVFIHYFFVFLFVVVFLGIIWYNRDKIQIGATCHDKHK